MSRIQSAFEQLKANNKTAFVTFITAGDPHPDHTVDMMHDLVSSGADIIELGVPFSDPMADGPVIQLASERALAHHTSMTMIFDMVRRFRQDDDHTPIVLMGYANPIEIMGYAAFAERAVAAGVDGVIIVDLPADEADHEVGAILDAGLDPIFLLSPTTTDERVQAITERSRGFVYYVSLKGITGASHLDAQAVSTQLDRIRAKTTLPVGVGFGIKDAETAAKVGQVADAIIVGSAIVHCIAEHQNDINAARSAIRTLVSDMRTALDAA